jgi:hypothetical protein
MSEGLKSKLKSILAWIRKTWIGRNWVPITALLLAVVMAIFLLDYKPTIDAEQAKKLKHNVAVVGAAFALVGGAFQGVKSHARASASTLNRDDSRFFHHLGILWWILSIGAFCALVGEVLDI